MSEIFFKLVIEHLKTINREEFYKFILDPIIPATLAVKNGLEEYVYITKDDLLKIFREGKVQVEKLYLDINCTQLYELKESIQLMEPDLIITLRAHRRLLALSIIGTQYVQSIPIDLRLNEKDLEYYFLRETWQPFETVSILLGINPAPFLNTKPNITYSYEWRQASIGSFQLIYKEVFEGIYDEWSEERIIQHAHKQGYYLLLTTMHAKMWRVYDTIITWETKKPLEILNKLFTFKFLDINPESFNEYEKSLMYFVNKIRKTDSEFKNSYSELDSFLNQFMSEQIEEVSDKEDKDLVKGLRVIKADMERDGKKFTLCELIDWIDETTSKQNPGNSENELNITGFDNYYVTIDSDSKGKVRSERKENLHWQDRNGKSQKRAFRTLERIMKQIQ